MKIGIYGGTFDPIHTAHLIIAEYACCELLFDRLYFVPSYIPPHKLSTKITSHVHRLDMLKLAIEKNRKFAVSEFEISKEGTSFTVDTLHYFQQHQHVSKTDLYLLIGADNFSDFHTWKDPDKIVDMAQIVVASRPHISASNAKYKDFITLNSPLLDVSASMIRQRIRDHKSVRYLLPDKVADYIRKNGLYQ